MKIDYISDLHLDFYVKLNSDEKKYKEQTEQFLNTLFPETLGEILIVAGDISHYNRQSYWALHYFSKLYDKVFYCLGNHDYYLISNQQQKKYKYNSVNREMELMGLNSLNRKVVFLYDFMVYEYKGFKIAGNTNWYSLSDTKDFEFFKNYSNDSRLIKCLDINKQSVLSNEFYANLNEVDILVTHVPTTVIRSHIKDNNTSCYLNELAPKAKYNVFGHVHEQVEYEKDQHKYYINALGYPDEYIRNMCPLKFLKEEKDAFKEQWRKIKSFNAEK